MLGFFHPMDTLPLESNNNPYGMGTRASPNDEQIRALMPCEIASVPRVLEPTSGDPFLWDINPALPVNAPPLIMTSPSRHALQPCELGFNLHDMGKVFL